MPGFADSFWSSDYAAGEQSIEGLVVGNVEADRTAVRDAQDWASCSASFSRVSLRVSSCSRLRECVPMPRISTERVWETPFRPWIA